MKHFRSLISLFLTLALVLGISAVPVWAGDSAQSTGCGSIVNPLYPELSEEPSLQSDDTLAAPSLRSSSADFISIDEAAVQLRDYMRSRTGDFTLYIHAPGYEDSISALVSDVLIPKACSEDIAVGINSGDYLAWSWRGVKFGWSLPIRDGNLTLTMRFTYHSSAEQEAQLLQGVAQTVQSLKLARLSDYEKYLGIYQFITGHVTYDSDALNRGDTSVLTAYGALVNGKAVCQGYATLFYAMCRSLSLPVRIITSSDHAWNIVKLGDLWYSLDSTWDGGSAEGTLWYFLKGTEHFANHNASAQYLTEEFTASYPLSKDDYTPSDADRAPAKQFADVRESDYFYEQVSDMADRGLVNGMTVTAFQPEGTTTRAMLVTVLWRMAGSPSVSASSNFTDVPADAYYAGSVAWAQTTGITTGTSNTTFSPDELLTRQQLAAFLYRYAKHQGYDLNAADSLGSFPDADTIEGYARAPIAWAVGAGIIQGFPGNLVAPQGHALRCQMAVMLSRFISYYKL